MWPAFTLLPTEPWYRAWGIDRPGLYVQDTGCGLKLFQCPTHHSLPDSSGQAACPIWGQRTVTAVLCGLP
jgi:hypothetical protein